MKKGAIEQLKYDKRLQTRSQWLKPADRDHMEAALPDEASKAAGPEQAGQGDAAQPEAPATPEA
jgi:hypothetical protein